MVIKVVFAACVRPEHEKRQLHLSIDLECDLSLTVKESRLIGCYRLFPTYKQVVNTAAIRMCTCETAG